MNKHDEIMAALEAADIGGHTVKWGTYSRIAAAYSVSREWVRRLAESQNYLLEAKSAGKEPTFCKSCGLIEVRQRNYLCDDCRMPEYTCNNCGKTIRRNIHEVEPGQQTIFCNRKCLGAYNGKHYGWGAPH